jgi:MFS family permease
VIGQLAAMVYIGPTFGALHNMVEPRMRATAVAIVFMLTSLIGIGLGPVLIGFISDTAAAALHAGDWSTCRATPALPGCGAASLGGLRIALIAGALLYIWPGIHYFLASTTLREDLLTPIGGSAEK